MIDVVVRTETETGKTVVVVTIGRETVTAVVEIVTGIMGMTEIEKETGLVVMIQGVVEDHVHQPEIIQEIMTTEGAMTGMIDTELHCAVRRKIASSVYPLVI